MRTGIFTGQLRHRRFRTRKHQFSYSVFMVLVDLDAVQSLFPKASFFWGQRALSLVRFQRGDYLPGVPDLGDEVRQTVQRKLGSQPAGRILLLTNPRIAGYLINPISIFYCFNSDQQSLHSIVLEVTNTPWGERQRYVLACDPERSKQRITFNKAMHVSPFMPMDMQYDLRVSTPAQLIAVHLRNMEHEQLAFDATLRLRFEGSGRRAKTAVLLRYPLMTLKVWAAIHWQAVRLFLKKIPVVPHPDKRAAN